MSSIFLEPSSRSPAPPTAHLPHRTEDTAPHNDGVTCDAMTPPGAWCQRWWSRRAGGTSHEGKTVRGRVPNSRLLATGIGKKHWQFDQQRSRWPWSRGIDGRLALRHSATRREVEDEMEWKRRAGHSSRARTARLYFRCCRRLCTLLFLLHLKQENQIGPFPINNYWPQLNCF